MTRQECLCAIINKRTFELYSLFALLKALQTTAHCLFEVSVVFVTSSTMFDRLGSLEEQV